MIINSSIKKYNVGFHKEFDIGLVDYKKGDVVIIDKNISINNTDFDLDIIEL